MTDLHSIDPIWAWSPCEAGWTRRAAAHLYRRAGFCASSDELDAAVARPPADVVRDLVQVRGEPAAYLQEMGELAATLLAAGDATRLPAWWTYRMLTTADPLREKATLLWHGHFATSAARVADARLMFRQNELLRRHSLTDFGRLVHEVARDPAMLIFLDSATNRKAHPNENFAREVMELYCLGEGRYSEEDVRQLARCLTGWEVRNHQFRVNLSQHDAGTKTVLGTTGTFDGDAGLDVVLSRPAVAEHVVRRLFRFFVIDEPPPSDALIRPLADQFRDCKLQVAPVLETILSSRLFFSPLVRGAKVRSPVEFGVGLLRALEGTSNAYELASGMAEAGQNLFFPPSVKGWDGGRAWINSSTLLARANLVRKLLDLPETRFAGAGLADLFDRLHLERPRSVVDWFAEVLFAVELTPDIRIQLARRIESGAGDREERLRSVLHVMCTLPEFQLG